MLARAAVLFGMAALVALVVLLAGRLPAPPERGSPAGQGREQSNVATRADKAAFRPGAEPQRPNNQAKADRVPKGAKPPLPPGWRLVEPPYELISSNIFAAGSRRFILAGVEGPGPRSVCIGGDGALWACGLYARAALNNAMQGHEVQCGPPGDGADPGESACRVDGRDLAGEMVALGWVRPRATNMQAFARELAEAQANGRGLWNGGWTIRP